VASEAPTLNIGEPVGSAWREQALARIGEQRTMTSLLRGRTELSADEADVYVSAIDGHLQAVEDAARSPHRLRSMISGAPIERVASNLDAVECDLLRLASPDYVREQMPSVLAHVRRHLRPADPRRVDIEALAKLEAKDWKPSFAETVIGAVHAASSKARRETRQVRSFRNTLWVATLMLALAAGGMALLGILEPTVIQLCFQPEGGTACPVGNEANAWDVPVVELLGLVAAAVAAAVSLRNVQGTTSPYSLPIALAMLKLPLGALTALLGILLMRGAFVPGLSNLDSSAQILSWAVVFGYSQQLLTQFVDKQAHTVLDNVRSGGTAPAEADAELTAATR
jgi:hypothetical protein